MQRVERTEASKTIALTGEIRAQVDSELGFRVSGRILERKAGVGDHVEAGQVLARLDPREAQFRIQAAEAEVRAAEANLANERAAAARGGTLFRTAPG